MYVRQGQRSRRVRFEHREQRGQTAARPGVDDHVADPPDADHARASEMQQVY
jgi:hypothetical protein